MRSARYRAVLLIGALLCACSDQTTVAAPTQVMLRVYNNDAALLKQMTELQVVFSLRQKNAWRTYPAKTFPKAVLSWPVDIPVIPTHKEDAFAQFEVVVRANASKTVLAEMRAVTTFVPDEHRVLELWLYRCGGSDTPRICAKAGCHGDECEVCKVDGTCGPIGAIAGKDLPPLKDDQTPQAKSDPSGMDSGTAGAGGAGGIDGGENAGDGSDGSVGMDAMVTPDADCSTLMCDGNARCVESKQGPHCECLDGYEKVDDVCEDINECKQPDHGGCSTHATCANKVGSRVCTCKKGFTDTRGDGTECIDACSLADCAKDATCSIVSGKAECSCPPDYVGDGDTSCVFDSQCSALNCDANALCKVTGSTRACECRSGYEGDGTTCTNPDACKPTNPCKNGGTCTDGLGDFTCDCDGASGFSGPTCEVNDDDCAPGNPCMNGGVCSDLVDDFSCDCDDTGFNGKQCQSNINDCPNNACTPGGTCNDAVNDYSCTCNAGYSPSSNGKACNNINDCTSGACMPGGTCVDGVQGYTCNCTTAGYMASGMMCIDINDCSPNPCQNGGKCSDLVNDHSCDCTGTGHVGKNCDTISAGCSAVGSACTVGVGACSRSGHYICPDGNNLSCDVSPGTGTAETCNGIDDNCVGGIDEGLADSCVGQSWRTCNGTWMMTDCSTLSPAKTCFNNACGGVCAVGKNRCLSGNSQTCNAVGAWAANPTHGTCTTSPPERCDTDTNSGTYGTCIDNSPFSVGNSASGGDAFPMFDMDLIAQPIIAPDNVTLTQFGIRATSDSMGGQVYLALYSDQANEPHTLLTNTVAFGLVKNSQNLQPPQSSSVQLTKNTRYWIVASLSVGASSSPQIFSHNTASAAGAIRLGSKAFGSPTNLVSGDTAISGGETTIFINVQR